jgi:hypothetical protein
MESIEEINFHQFISYKDEDQFPEIKEATKKPQGSCFLYVKQSQGKR